MSRLLDRILRDPLLASRMGPVEGLPVIDASSVADLYAESPTMGVEEASWPNAAPPFPVCWFEFGAPREVVLGPGKTQAWGPPWPRAWGFRVQVLEDHALSQMPQSQRLQERRDEVRWVYEASMWAEYGPSAITQDSRRVHAVDGQGGIVDQYTHLSQEVVRAFYDGVPAIASWLHDQETGERLDNLEAARRYMEFEIQRSAICYDCLLLAMSLMHCRNVRLQEHAPAPKVAKKAAQRHGRPPVTYSTIVVDPMLQVLRGEGGMGQHGLARALHICRGHFRTYSEDRPLFGVPGRHGTFWTPQHVRGTQDAGAVVGIYKIRGRRPE